MGKTFIQIEQNLDNHGIQQVILNAVICHTGKQYCSDYYIPLNSLVKSV
jgi:hypothetical protein